MHPRCPPGVGRRKVIFVHPHPTKNTLAIFDHPRRAEITVRPICLLLKSAVRRRENEVRICMRGTLTRIPEFIERDAKVRMVGRDKRVKR